MKKPVHNSPPEWVLHFFRWFCHPDFVEDIEGDLLERFAGFVEVMEPRNARIRFFIEVVLLFRWGLIRPLRRNYFFIPYAMFKHNLIISYRNFLRSKTTFFIHLIGLSTGLASAFLIYLWVQDEIGMDKFHEHDEQLYQVMREARILGEAQLVEWAPGPLVEAIKTEIPGIKYATSYKTHPALLGGIGVGDQHIRAVPLYADQSYLEVFSFPLLHGNKSQVLKDKYAAVISEDLALQIYGETEEAIGKIISWEKNHLDQFARSRPLVVSGVFKSLPENSTETFDVILNIELYIEHNPGVKLWTNDQATAAVVLEKGINIDNLETKISQLSNTHTDFERTFVLKRYSSKYLYNQYDQGIEAGGRIIYVWLFSIIAILVLLVACINFMNLSTAKASNRLKEIALKKTLGANRKSLILQFISESLFISFFALIVALGLVVFLLPFFNEITGKQISFDLSLTLMGAFLAITTFTGFISSIYPALYLSALKPIQILSGKFRLPGKEIWTRKGLVVFQFSVSIFFIVSVQIIYQQISFVNTQNLGFDKDHILSLKIEGVLRDKTEPFLTEVRKLPEVVQASSSSHVLVGASNWTGGIDWEGREEDEALIINPIVCNHYFVETYDIQIKEGRSFSPEYGTDSSKVILNETAIKSMRLEDPVGQLITFWGNQVEIIGVVEDFHFESLYKQVGPCIIKLAGKRDDFRSYIWIKMRGGQEKEAIESIKHLYTEFNPGFTFEYGFIDETYQALYESENRVFALSKYFAILAILISCLGLFGLTAFTSEQRTKEIGIRKILGASVWNIVRLLSLDFSKMVLLSILISMPISYYFARRWLENFAYKIDLAWWFFATSALSALLIACLTVSFQTIRAARAKPVNSLRSE
ncbi:MAG: FtsX-like permease family protein [Bacteroidota bacterium]